MYSYTSHLSFTNLNIDRLEKDPTHTCLPFSSCEWFSPTDRLTASLCIWGIMYPRHLNLGAHKSFLRIQMTDLFLKFHYTIIITSTSLFLQMKTNLFCEYWLILTINRPEARNVCLLSPSGSVGQFIIFFSLKPLEINILYNNGYRSKTIFLWKLRFFSRKMLRVRERKKRLVGAQ